MTANHDTAMAHARGWQYEQTPVGNLARAYLALCGGRQPLTKRLREIYDYLAAYIGDRGYAPTFEEIADKFAYQSLATVHEHLGRLEQKGWIRRSFNETRGIALVEGADSTIVALTGHQV